MTIVMSDSRILVHGNSLILHYPAWVYDNAEGKGR